MKDLIISEKLSNSIEYETSQLNSPVDDDRIPLDGFKQVLEMLKIADPTFRESLLNRLEQRDQELARILREDLASLGF